MAIETQVDPKVQFGTALQIAAQTVQQAGIFSLDETGTLRLTKVDLTQVVISGGGGSVSGSGTANKVAKFTGASVLGDSQITDNGASISAVAATSVTITASAGNVTIGSSLKLEPTSGTSFTCIAGTSFTVIAATAVQLTSSTSSVTMQAATSLTLTAVAGTASLISTGVGGVSIGATDLAGVITIIATSGVTVQSSASAVTIQSAGVAGVGNVVITSYFSDVQIASAATGSILLNGVGFLGSTTVAGLTAAPFAGAGLAFAYVTNLRNIDFAASLGGGLTYTAAQGGLVQRLVAGGWFLPGTNVAAS